MERLDPERGSDVSQCDMKTEKVVRLRLLLQTAFHCLFVAYWIGVNGYAFNFLPVLLKSEHYKVRELAQYAPAFATNWNVMFQSIFVVMALVYDLLEWTDRHDSSFGKKLKYFRDVLYCSIVTPLTLFVTCMFWSVYAVDRTLVFPVVFDDVVPWWFNHCVHTYISVIVLLETILTARRHPTDRKLERKLCAIICIAYSVVYYSIFFISGRWLYDVFGKMTWWQVCLFQCVIFISFLFFYIIQFPINRLFHRADDGKTANVEEQSLKNGDLINGAVTIEEDTKVSDNETPYLDQPWSLKHRNNNPREISEKTKL